MLRIFCRTRRPLQMVWLKTEKDRNKPFRIWCIYVLCIISVIMPLTTINCYLIAPEKEDMNGGIRIFFSFSSWIKHNKQLKYSNKQKNHVAKPASSTSSFQIGLYVRWSVRFRSGWFGFSDFRCYVHKYYSVFTSYRIGFDSIPSGFGSDRI